MPDVDVIVVGAGPAGLTAAHHLAHAGHDVVVLEEHPIVGRPVHCTGLLGLESFDEFDLPRHTILGVADSARFWGSGGRPVLFEHDVVKAAIIDRAAFDSALADRAERAGATICSHARVERLEMGPKAVHVEVAGRPPIVGRACVLACGANYRFHRRLGLGTPAAFLQTAQVETPFVPRSHVDVRFGRELAPAGFAWTVPFEQDGQTYARIGLMCRNRVRQRFAALIELLANETGIARHSLPPPRLKILPLAAVRKSYCGRLVVVGDAAGVAKPTTGGGIYYSLLTGSLAGETLDEALRRSDLSEQQLCTYEMRWRAAIGSELRLGLAFRTLATRLGDQAVDALLELGRIDGLAPLIKRHANFNRHSGLALALFRHQAFRRAVVASLLS